MYFRWNVFHSIKYKKIVLTDDTMVLLKSGQFEQIIAIIKKNNLCYFKISKIITSSEKPFNVLHIDQIESEDIVNDDLISISDINCKVIHVNVGNNVRYLCKMPNQFEVQ